METTLTPETLQFAANQKREQVLVWIKSHYVEAVMTTEGKIRVTIPGSDAARKPIDFVEVIEPTYTEARRVLGY
jgi:hypothetical protein